MKKIIDVENLSKIYDLGLVGTGTLSKDLNRIWAKMLGKPDPYATLAELNDRTKKSDTNMVYALKDINFSVKQGEVIGIIGKNGAGKSTLLKILSQITSPSTGSIKMNGRVASLLEVGTGMHPEMTARQNIYLNGSLLGMSRREISSKFDEIVEFAGVEKYVDTPTKRFSSGMTVRLGFAIAAFLEPEILIVDEVLAVGDAEFQKKAIGKMQDVSKGEGRTVLFVSHNMGSIESLCSRALLLKNGGLYLDGKTDDIVREYLAENYEEIDTESGDIPDTWERPWGQNGAKFKSLRVINSKGDYTRDLLFKEPFSVEILFECYKELTNCDFQLRVATLSGQQLTLSSSASDLKEGLTFKKGTNRLLISMNPQFFPNKYSFYIVLGPLHSGHYYDAVKDIYAFEVLPEAIDGKHIYNSKIHSFLNINTKWEQSI